MSSPFFLAAVLFVPEVLLSFVPEIAWLLQWHSSYAFCCILTRMLRLLVLIYTFALVTLFICLWVIPTKRDVRILCWNYASELLHDSFLYPLWYSCWGAIGSVEAGISTRCKYCWDVKRASLFSLFSIAHLYELRLSYIPMLFVPYVVLFWVVDRTPSRWTTFLGPL